MSAVDESFDGRVSAIERALAKRDVVGVQLGEALRAEAERSGAKRAVTRIDLALAGHRLESGNLASALTLFNTVRHRTVAEADFVGEVNALRGLGKAWAMMGDAVRARAIFALGRQLAHEAGDIEAEASHQLNYAFTFGENEDASRFVEHSLPGIALLRQGPPSAGLALALVNLAGGLVRLGHGEEARAALREAAALADRFADARVSAMIVGGMGELMAREGNVDAGLREIERSRMLLISAGQIYDALRTPLLSIAVLQPVGRHKDVAGIGAQAIAAARAKPYASVLCRLLERTAVSHAALGEFETAYAMVTESLAARAALSDGGATAEASLNDETERARHMRSIAEGRRADQEELSLTYRELAASLAREQRIRAVLEAQAVTDGLTGVYNRRGFEQQAEALIQTCRSRGWELALIVLDIDHFKRVNDAFGHAAGDAALRDTAERCSRLLREGDIFARIGGEEFAVLLPNAGIEQATLAAQRLRTAMHQHPVKLDRSELSITISLGVATLPMGGAFDDLLRAADLALYDAKRGGRDRVAVFSGRKPDQPFPEERETLPGPPQRTRPVTRHRSP